jgi:hypothetical protein
MMKRIGKEIEAWIFKDKKVTIVNSDIELPLYSGSDEETIMASKDFILISTKDHYYEIFRNGTIIKVE